MNYEAFFADIAEWINQSNQMAMQHGLKSNEFWSWVTTSMGQLSDKYGNNELVKRQMMMLWDWLQDIYEKS